MSANWANQTIWTGDNLPIMRGMNSDSVDLIYLDPPFNSNRNYEAPIGSKAAGASFKDAWTLDDIDVYEHGELAERSPAAYSAIEAARQTHGKSMQSYLIFMAVRLLEMKRILKTTGSIYLHCDDVASHYLKMLMDSVFGSPMFRNEIIWKRIGNHNDAGRFGRTQDRLLFYGADIRRKDVKVPLSDGNISSKYRHKDARGKYRRGDLTGAHPKPLALLDRIIKASSNPGDIVFDPFCGCATSLVAADRSGREWAGIDLSPLAIKLVNERIAEDRPGSLFGGAIALDEPPKRTDQGDLPNYRTHRHRLYGEQEGVCNGCDTHFPFKIMEVDHILPRSKGGTDHPDNLQLLCSACNRSKGGRTNAEWRVAQDRAEYGWKA